MKVSKIGLKKAKLNNLNEQFPAQDMLVQTGQLSSLASGIYTYGHIPYLVEQNVENIIRKVLPKYEAAEISLPLLQPETIWEESGRLEGYINSGEMFRCLTDKGNFCLAPTAEEAVVRFANERLSSYRQLPVTYFQIGEKFRNEMRARGFLLRGKAFNMLDAYSFGRNQADLDFEYDQMKNAFLEIFNELGLETIPVVADNGAIGGSISEEFMCISDVGQDDILVSDDNTIALNTEILEREDAKEYLKENYGINDLDSLTKKKAVELGHIFQLDDKYSISMNATFTNEEDKQQAFFMGCYGLGVSRTVAMIYENNILENEKEVMGVVLPENIAPYLIYIIPKTDDLEKMEKAFNIYEQLKSKGVAVLIDDREGVNIGAKIKDSKVTGTPYFMVFGNTLDQGFVELENNKTGEKTELELGKVVDYFVKN